MLRTNVKLTRGNFRCGLQV